jgi:hypothetical protein
MADKGFKEGHMNQGQINLYIRELQARIHDLEALVRSHQELFGGIDVQLEDIERRLK